MSLPNAAASAYDLRQRVNVCLNKLADRDTLAVATTELESIARALTHDGFSPFLNCISSTDSSQKSPVRKQCVRLLGFLSENHGDALSTHLPKMLAGVLRRLRDSDSAVRSACVDAVGSMASQITKTPFSSFLKPLVDSLLHEQDHNSQIGSAMCLAAVVEASPEPEPAQLQKLLPKLMKLVKSDCFKAKAALISLMGSITSVGGASNRSLLSLLVPSFVEFLSSDDWAARKAAAEALAKLAVAEKGILSEFRPPCLASLESRRFDKVKVVRDTMNRTLELWKDVPDKALLPSQSQSQSKASDDSGNSPSVSGSTRNDNFETPKPNKTIPARRFSLPENSPATLTPKKISSKGDNKKPSASMFSKVDCTKNTEIAVPEPSTPNLASEDHIKDKYVEEVDTGENETNNENFKLETKRVLFTKTREGSNVPKARGSRFGSRVVPIHENDNSFSDIAKNNNPSTDDVDENPKDVEDLDLIRRQLVQIQNQQSSLLDLLQRFMGSSQSGINSLETRVNGLETALEEISYDLAISTGRIPNAAGNTCCKLPGSEFLSPKFWKRTENQYASSSPSSRLSFSAGNNHHSMRGMLNRDGKPDLPKMDSPKFCA